MRAIVCHQHGSPVVMQYEEVPDPRAAADDLVVKAEAIGVNFVDTMRRSGLHPTAPEPPFTPGIELCGEVVEVGSNVSGFARGDRVIGRCVTHGAYAELVCVESRFAVPCPAEIPAPEAASLFVNGQTAFHALSTVGNVRPQENALITAAAGGVGLCAVQMANLLGANVLAAASSDEKLQLTKEFGADQLINYSHNDWPQQVLDSTDGVGATLVLESVGGAVFERCLACWAAGGRIVVFGQASGKPGTVSADQLLFGNRSVYGLAVGTVIENESLMRSTMEQIFEWHQQGRFRVLVGETHSLRDAAIAHQRLESRQTQGKVVLKP